VATNLKIKVHISGHSDQMSKISGELLISGQFQDICHISGISGQLGALHLLHNSSIWDIS